MAMPARMILAAHWSRADLPAFRDFPSLKCRFDSPRKTFATTTKPAVLYLRHHRAPHKVSIVLLDTMLLAPASHRSLDAIGRMLDLPKIELPAGAISKMREFLSSDPQRFTEYAIRDAEIAACYTFTVGRFFREIGALSRGGSMPPTLGAAAVNLFRTISAKRGIDLDPFLGRNGRKILPEFGDHITTFAECFHGGRNEAFSVGYTPRAPDLRCRPEGRLHNRDGADRCPRLAPCRGDPRSRGANRRRARIRQSALRVPARRHVIRACRCAPEHSA